MEDFRFDGSFNAWLALGWSVIVLSLGAITLLMLLIRHGEVSRVSGLIFLVPGVSALMAYGLFGETLILQIAGMAVCAGAVLIVTRKPVSPCLRRSRVSRARSRWSGFRWVRIMLIAANSTAMSSVKPRPRMKSGTTSKGRMK